MVGVLGLPSFPILCPYAMVSRQGVSEGLFRSRLEFESELNGIEIFFLEAAGLAGFFQLPACGIEVSLYLDLDRQIPRVLTSILNVRISSQPEILRR